MATNLINKDCFAIKPTSAIVWLVQKMKLYGQRGERSYWQHEYIRWRQDGLAVSELERLAGQIGIRKLW